MDGGDMDHFLVFLSTSGLPQWMAMTRTIFWSFCHCEISRGRWRWHGPFTDLSVTVTSAAADGGGMDQFLVFLSSSGLPQQMAEAWTIFFSF